MPVSLKDMLRNTEISLADVGSNGPTNLILLSGCGSQDKLKIDEESACKFEKQIKNKSKRLGLNANRYKKGQEMGVFGKRVGS